MMRFREWYDGKGESESWALIQAMSTIRNAQPADADQIGDSVADGRATWLLPLSKEGCPMVEQLASPLSRVPSALVGKDWTRYEGLLHTDHAVRAEFFQDRDVAPTSNKTYLMDFTYLYNDADPEFERFAKGIPFTKDQVYAEIGRPEEWMHRAADSARHRTPNESAEVAQQLQACRSWTDDYPPVRDA